MRITKRSQWLIAATMVLLLNGGVWARGADRHALSLLVVPERINVVQVSFDIADKRPVALVTYRGDGVREPLMLHAWTGQEWWPISLEEYRDGRFLIRKPVRIILVGGDLLLPEKLVEASDWGPLVLSLETTESDELLNAIGRMLDFTRSEWRWFAQRYNMDIEDQSPLVERESWYDQMTRARQQANRRVIDEPTVAPVVPAREEPVRPPPEPIRPGPVIEPDPAFEFEPVEEIEPEPDVKELDVKEPAPEIESEPEPRAQPRPETRARMPVPIVEADEWTDDDMEL